MPKRQRALYQFGEFQFTSKDAVQKFFRTVREEAGVGGTVVNPAHALAVAELFRGHVDYTNKQGCGVRRYFVDFAPDHPNTTCFWIERENGDTTDFGISACIQTIATLNRQSFRALIRAQIYAFKDARLLGCDGTFRSDLSGESHPVSEAHVDHEVEFERIVSEFAAIQGTDLETELLTIGCDARSLPTWKDDSLAERFLRFHAGFPLRLVSKRENLSDLRRKRTT